MKLAKWGAVEAQKQFQRGGNLDSNPYPKDAPQWSEYRWEMHKLEVMDFQGTLAEIKAGI